MLLFGVVEGGRVLFAWLVITNEAREGARWGAVRVGDPAYATNLLDQVTIRVRDRLAGTLEMDANHLAIVSSLAPAPPSPDPNRDPLARPGVSVAISYKVDIVMPFIRDLWSNALTVRAQSQMRAE